MAASWGLCEQNAEVHGGYLSFFSSCSPGRAESCPEAPHTVCPTGMASGCQPLPPRALTELKLSQAGQWATGETHLSPMQAQSSTAAPGAPPCLSNAKYKHSDWVTRQWCKFTDAWGKWYLSIGSCLSFFPGHSEKCLGLFLKIVMAQVKSFLTVNIVQCTGVCPDQKQGVWGNTFLSCLHCFQQGTPGLLPKDLQYGYR